MADSYEMRGPRQVRHTVCEFLRNNLPAHADAARAAWGLTAAELPIPNSVPGDPKHDAYVAHEPVAIDRWPMLAVTSGRRRHRNAPNSVTHDFDDDGSPIYMGQYDLRVYCWVKADGWDATQDQRDDLATLVQITMLSHVDLGTGGTLMLDPKTLLVDFSQVQAVKGDRFVAGAYVGFGVYATETLSDRLALPGGQPRDTVSGVSATGSVLQPPHPALM